MPHILIPFQLYDCKLIILLISDGGIANGGFVGDNGYSVVNEKASPESRVCKREPRDFDKGMCEEGEKD